ncbi:MAG: hypothetical protein IJT71_01540 [Oscillospiraceae bacterium]|nr:hypothetical protein [Oscillospiraceae bacterium]
MEEVRISDVTMKALGAQLSFREKLELAKQLDRLGVSVIELEGVENAKADALRVKSVALAVKESAVAVPVALSREGADAAWNAIRDAKRPRLQVVTPTSTVQMEYLCHKKPDAMLALIRELVAYCREKCADVEFVADDATRAEPDYLRAALRAAIEAGAATVTVCDAAGAMLPREFAAFFEDLYETVPALRSVSVGVACSDALAMADACAVTAVLRGAREVKAAAYPANRVSLSSVAKVLAAKGEGLSVRTRVRTTELGRGVSQIARLFEASRNTPYDGFGGDEHAGMTLSAHDDRAAVLQAVAKLGYDLSAEDETAVWDAFQRIARRKEALSARELDAIVAAAAMQVPTTYEVKSYVVNSGSGITAMAHLKLAKGGRELEGVALGDGPIDAAFLALEQVTGRHCEMDDFQIRTVTEGHEAMGETVVRLRAGGKLYAGRGISTDIVGASIRAYVNALNKIAYEEETT